MPYSVQFVGLVCFYRELGGRLALLPDGRNPGKGIDPHYGSLVVAADSIEEAETANWVGVKGVRDITFPLVPCHLIIEGADVDGALDTTGHVLPQLRDIDKNFEIDPPRAKTIAQIRIRQGTLTSYLIPGGAAAMSQLDVAHDGPIRIKMKPDDGSPECTIVAKPGTEIAITNMARGSVYDEAPAGNGSHFKIYEKLSVNPVSLKEPPAIAALTESHSRHPLFSRRGPIGLYVDCSNTGCCG
jgi:hypothetical protein